MPLQEIADRFGVSLSSIKCWKTAWKTGRVDALAAKPHPRPACKLSEKQKGKLVKLLLAGPLAAGFRTDLWTCARVAELVRKQFKVKYHPDHLGRILHDLGFSPQKPRQVAREQDAQAVERWRKEDWPRIKKKTRRRGATIVFIDETGFRLQPVNRRTWAPTGQTPVQWAWDRYDRLSVIGAVTLSPVRGQIDTPFQIHERNLRTDEVVGFVKQLRQRYRRPLIICWDRWQVHRSAAKKISASKMRGIEFEGLPAYAPELNPVESRWSHAKFGTLANFVPEDTPELKRTVRNTLKAQKLNPRTKQSYFKTAKPTL